MHAMVANLGRRVGLVPHVSALFTPAFAASARVTPADDINAALHAAVSTAVMATFLSLLLVVTNTCMETLLVELCGNDA